MKRKRNILVALRSTGALLIFAGTALSQTTYTGDGNTKNDRWNIATNWTGGAVPSGAVDVIIATANPHVTCWSNATPTYTGNLTLEANTTLQMGWTSNLPGSFNALGTPGSTTIFLNDGSTINSRTANAVSVPAIELQGDALIITGQSTQTSADPTFGEGITGPHTLTFNGKADSDIYLTAPNTFGTLVADPTTGNGFNIRAQSAGSLGCDVTILATGGGAVCADLFIGDSSSTIAASDVMADTATLNLFGDSNSTLLTIYQDDTIAALFINSVEQPGGTYGDIASTHADFPVSWIDGDGLLTIIGSPATYWDINDATAGAGGATPAGTWDLNTSTNWDTATDGTGAGVLWSSSAGGTAVFAAGSDATGSYTVTVDGTQDIGGMIFEEGDATLAGDGLQMTSDSQVSVAAGATGTIDSTISNDIDRLLSKAGAGTLVLTGANSYGGATRVLEGTLSVASLADAGTNSPIGNYPTAGADGLVLSGTLEYTGGSATIDRGFSLTGDSTIDLSGSATALTLGDCEAETAGTLTVTGGAGSTLSLGNVRVVEGAFLTLNPTTEPLTAASVEGYTGYPVPNATITFGGTATGNVVTGTITRTIPPGTPFSRGINVVKSDTGDWTVLGAIGPDGSNLTVNAGTLTLSSGSSNYTGTTAVNGGTLIAANNVPSANNQNGAFGRTNREIPLGQANSSTDASILIEGPYTVGRNIRLMTADNDSGTRVLTLGGTTDDTTAFTGNIVLGDNSRAGRGVNLTAVTGGNVTFSGVIQDPSPVDPTAYSVTKTGDGTVLLTNANAYGGDTVVSAGTLSLGDGTTNSNLADVSTLSVETGAVLDLNYSGADAVFFLNLGGSPAAGGTWGASGSGADNINDTFFTGTGVINNTGGILLPGLYAWDGGDIDNTANGDGASDGGDGSWDLVTLNWDRGITAHAAWGNTTGDQAILGGTPGIVALDADITIGEMLLHTGQNYRIGSADETHSLNFGGNALITADQVDATIWAGVTGSPTINHTGRGFTNDGFLTLDAGALTMTLGDINKIRNPANARNEALNLGGSSVGNSAGAITWTNGGQQLFLNKVGTGTWTLNGGYDDGPSGDARFKVLDGTLVLNGTYTTSHEISVQNGGTLKGNADLRVSRTGGTEQVRVLGGGTLAPGTSVGTINVVNDNLEIDGTLEIELDGNTADLVTVNGNLDLSAATDVIKVVELGAPSASSYTVVTYTGSLTGTFDTEDLPAGYSVNYSTPNEINLIAPVVGGSAFDTWAAAAGLDGTPGKENGTGDDPDAGGKTNLYEFGFNGDPLDSFNEGLLHGFIGDGDSDTDDDLLFTIAVRTGTVFTAGSPATSAAVDGIVYAVGGDDDLDGFDNDTSVSVAATAVVPAGAPDLSGNPDYEYVTLILDGSVRETLDAGFMRASVAVAP